MSYRSSFHGRLLEIDGVSVDNFTGTNLSSRAFFLSHCHTDHTQGLHDEDFKRVLANSEGTVKVYMSDLSAAIVRLGASEELSKAITVLKLGTVHIKLPATDKLKEEYISVTAIPAGHCLGSVMLLFQTSRDQNILYTGDFRIRENDVDKYAQLHKGGKPIKIDTVYMDTTFLDPQYSNFPKRTDCMDELVQHISEWLKNDENNRVALSTSAKYGYEYVFMELSRKLRTKIFVEQWKWNFYSKLPFMEPAVSNDEKYARVHACLQTNGNYKHVRCGLKDDPHNYLFIRMSAQRFKDYENTYTSPVTQTMPNRLDVCFPTHCSSSEIKAFVDYYEPRRIVGFPNDYVANDEKVVSDVPILQRTPKGTPRKWLSGSPSAKRSKLDRKEDGDVLRQLFS